MREEADGLARARLDDVELLTDPAVVAPPLPFVAPQRLVARHGDQSVARAGGIGPRHERQVCRRERTDPEGPRLTRIRVRQARRVERGTATLLERQLVAEAAVVPRDAG